MDEIFSLLREAKLPEQIFAYAKKLKNPDKSMVKLLRLIVDQGLEPVLKALEIAQEKQQYSLDIIEFNLTKKSQVIPLPTTGPVVNPVDIKAYDQLLSGGAQI